MLKVSTGETSEYSCSLDTVALHELVWLTILFLFHLVPAENFVTPAFYFRGDPFAILFHPPSKTYEPSDT